MFHESYVLLLQKVNCTLYFTGTYKAHRIKNCILRVDCRANCNDSHLDASQDGEGAAAKDGVLQDGGDVLVAGLDQADRLAEGKGQGASAVMVLEVLADWEVSVHRNTELGEVISRTHA